MTHSPSPYPDAFLNRDTAELLPAGGRHVRVECQAPGEAPSHLEAGYNTETLANAVGDLARMLVIRRSTNYAGDIAILFLDQRRAALGSLTVDAGFLLRQGRWPGQPGVRHANALSAMLANYCAVRAIDLLHAIEAAAGDPAFMQEIVTGEAATEPPAAGGHYPDISRPVLRGRAG